MEEVDRTVPHERRAANFPDPADRASQEEEFSLELRTCDRERKLIKKKSIKPWNCWRPKNTATAIPAGGNRHSPPGSAPHRYPVCGLQNPGGN